MAAVTQISHDTPGRVYYLRKQDEGKTRKEATRALKRHISDAVYQRLLSDTRRQQLRLVELEPTTTDGLGRTTRGRH